MIDIQFIPDDWERIDTCFGAFYAGETIVIGCSDLDYCERRIKNGELIGPFEKYSNMTELILGIVEEAITHETIHIIINRWFGVGASLTWDNMDYGGLISNNGI